jgi:glycosyltransferase involved in cell wall biosynthesis
MDKIDPSRSPPLLIFADDWGRHPSSCQHLVRHLLGRFQVHWVNTIGTRPPGLNRTTLRRGQEPQASSSRPANLSVWNPKMWPWITRGFDRRLNRELLYRQLAPKLRALPTCPIAVTTVPIVADLIGRLPVRRWVYYCVDDFGEWPGLARAALQQLDDRLIARADAVVAVSETLQEKLGRRGRASRLLTHGIEPGFWQGNGHPPRLHYLEGLPRPLIIFWGVIDRRMDVAFVQRLAGELKRGTIVLVGPDNDPDPALFALPRVVRVPAVPFADLPALARAGDVLIMPYADLPVTRAMQPLKLKEYLATGKPAVVRDLPATRGWKDCLDLADTPAVFAELVLLRLRHGLPEWQRQGRVRLGGESWAEKARQFTDWALSVRDPQSEVWGPRLEVEAGSGDPAPARGRDPKSKVRKQLVPVTANI